MIHYTVQQFIAEGDDVAVRVSCRFRSKKSNKEVETLKADFFRFRDGRIVELFEFYDTARVLAVANAG